MSSAAKRLRSNLPKPHLSAASPQTASSRVRQELNFSTPVQTSRTSLSPIDTASSKLWKPSFKEPEPQLNSASSDISAQSDLLAIPSTLECDDTNNVKDNKSHGLLPAPSTPRTQAPEIANHLIIQAAQALTLRLKCGTDESRSSYDELTERILSSDEAAVAAGVMLLAVLRACEGRSLRATYWFWMACLSASAAIVLGTSLVLVLLPVLVSSQPNSSFT